MSYTSREALFDTLYEGETVSPMNSEIPSVGGAVPEIATQAKSPLDSSSNAGCAFVPRPPDPAVGGQPGMTHALGWTTGLRISRAFRGLFGGQTLVMPSMGVHPIQGPVGYSTRTDRLVYGVHALTGNDVPTNQSVAEQYAANEQEAIALATAGNPNYA